MCIIPAFRDPVDMAFAVYGLGWRYEAGIQSARLVLARGRNLRRRILCSTDYPYQYCPGRDARGFLERVALSQ